MAGGSWAHKFRIYGIHNRRVRFKNVFIPSGHDPGFDVIGPITDKRSILGHFNAGQLLHQFGQFVEFAKIDTDIDPIKG